MNSGVIQANAEIAHAESKIKSSISYRIYEESELSKFLSPLLLT